jgi:hypothetical protein
MDQHLPLQDPPKFTQIWIFVLKINHLATLELNTFSRLQSVVSQFADFGPCPEKKNVFVVLSKRVDQT